MKFFATAASLAALALAAVPAEALTFTLVDQGGAAEGTQARLGYEVAAAYWSSVLTDNVNVTINIGYSSLGVNKPSQYTVTKRDVLVTTVATALGTDATSTIDADAHDYLPIEDPLRSGTNRGLSPISMIVNVTDKNDTNYSTTSTRTDSDGSRNNVALSVNTSVMKALGITIDANHNAIPDGADGGITLNSDTNYDFNPMDGVSDGASDFVAAAIQQMGHVLGFVSGVDTYDTVTGNKQGATGSARNTRQGVLDSGAVGSVLDLFRYHGPGQLDWSNDALTYPAYFSVQNGQADETKNPVFATGVKNGDGYIASGWAPSTSGCGGIVGIMSTDLCTGQAARITAADLEAMDATGWDLAAGARNNDAYSTTTADVYRAYMLANAPAVPEPASWAIMLGGFGLVGGAMRRHKAQPALG